MVKIIGQQNNPMDGLANVIAGFGQSVFGDQLTGALKRSQMQQAAEQAAALARTNQNTVALQNAVRSGDFSSPNTAAYGIGAGIDPKTLGGYGLLNSATQYGAADPRTQNFQVGSGQSFDNTAAAVNQKDATTRRGQDLTIAENRRQFDQKPMAVFDPTTNSFKNVPTAQAGNFSPVVGNSDMQGTLNAAQLARPEGQQYQGVSEAGLRALGVNSTTSMSNVGKMQQERQALADRAATMPADDPRREAVARQIAEYDRVISAQGRTPGVEASIDKGNAEQFLAMRKEMPAVIAQNNTLDVLSQLADQGVAAGSLSPIEVPLRRFMVSLGADDRILNNSDAFRAFSQKAVIDGLGSLGTGVSNADRDFLAQTVPTLTNTPQGIQNMVRIMKAVNQRKLENAKDAETYFAQKGQLDSGYYEAMADKPSIFANMGAAPAAPAGNTIQLPNGTTATIRQVQ